MSVNTKVNGQLVPSAGLYKVSVPIQSGDIYSFEERQVGVWADGKPLYQKTVDCGAGGNAQTVQIAHNVVNIDKYVACWGIFTNNGQPVPVPNGGNDFVRVQFDNTYIIIKYGTSWESYSGLYVTIQYTKTTDVAGSGEYVPSGDKAVHYSTNEQVIGTWIDGSTLYEKTVEGTTITGATTFSVPHGISNFNILVDANIVCKSSDNSYWRTLNFAYNNGTTNDNWLGGFAINDTNILFQIGSSFSQYISEWYATIRYTKTS